MTNDERNTLQETIAHFLKDMKKEQGDSFSLKNINLSEMERRTGISRKRLRLIKKHGFKVLPNGNRNRRRKHTVLSGYTGIIDDYLRRGVRNSHTITDIIQDNGYSGSRSQVKRYIASHLYLMPAKREVVSPQGNRGRRYRTEPGESFQIDWGFVNVDAGNTTFRAACFAMICHHCGNSYIEFFPNAKQENLFIGMIHAFEHLGIPHYVLTDNMKSVVNGRDADGHPLWNHEYAAFMEAVGFQTKLCKPRHPFTKGAVERLVRFVKESFMTGRSFSNITDLNMEALQWCENQNNDYHKASDCVPAREHTRHCMTLAREFKISEDAKRYLCPERRISFDGFVNYEGRRFGVPYSYKERVCRVMRKGRELLIISDDMQKILAKHDITWSHRDSFCNDQFVDQPEEFPTMPVKVSMKEQSLNSDSAFQKFDFDKEVVKNV